MSYLHLDQMLMRISHISSTIVFWVGCLVLLGWQFDIEVLKSVVPGWVTMKANTALAFAIAGISLRFIEQNPSSRWTGWISKGCAIAVLLIGLLHYIQYIFGWNLGIDQLLFQEAANSIATPYPGRMAITTAFCFLLSGIALLLIRQNDSHSARTAQIVCLFVLLIALQALMGYAYEVKVFYQLNAYTAPMALHAALAFCVLAIGILWVRPDQGLMRFLTSELEGGQVTRRLLPCAVLLPLASGWFVLLGLRQGFYDAAFALSLLVILLVIIFVILVGWSSAFLNQADCERRHVEEELRENTAILNAINESTPTLIFVKDRQGHLVMGNPALFQAIGQSPAEVLGQTDASFYTNPEEAEQVMSNDRQVMETGEVLTFEETLKLPSGRRTFLSTKSPYCDNQGNIIGLIGVSTDITDRKQSEEALRASEERFRLAARAVVGVVYDWDIKTSTVYRSEGLYQLTGFTSEEVPEDKNWWGTRIHPEDLARIESVMGSILASGDRYAFEYRVRHKQGHWVNVWDRGYLIRENGELVRVVGSTADISDRKQAEQAQEKLLKQEQAAREAAEQANRIKDEFLAVVSHELRTPLNPILGWSKLLQRGLNPAKTAQAIAIIERNAQLQVQLIEDLLDISRILRGKLTLTITSVDLSVVIAAALETVRLAAEAKSLQLQTAIDPLVGRVNGDAGRLQQVVWNLLSNAVKFTPEGGTIRVELAHNGRQAQLQVKDTGKGIRPDFLPYVFDYFRQEDGATTRKFGGLGLGLAIVSEIVELHGGTVGAESAGEGKGATFTVNLPLAALSVEPSPLEGLSQGTIDLSEVEILVVDDDADSRDILTFVLEQENATVITVASGLDALHAIAQSIPDLIISDIGMPEMDGYMLLRQIRQLPAEEGGNIPAIALTAYAGEINEQQAIAAGFQKHVAKPVELDQLRKAIASLIKEKKH